MHTGQQRDPRAVPDSGLNSPGLEEETVTITEDETQSRFSASADMATGIVRARGVLDRETLNSLRAEIEKLLTKSLSHAPLLSKKTIQPVVARHAANFRRDRLLHSN